MFRSPDHVGGRNPHAIAQVHRVGGARITRLHQLVAAVTTTSTGWLPSRTLAIVDPFQLLLRGAGVHRLKAAGRVCCGL
jgi:hypothetical protein